MDGRQGPPSRSIPAPARASRPERWCHPATVRPRSGRLRGRIARWPEFEIFRNQGQQHRAAHTRAECGLVVGGADHSGRARDAWTHDTPQGVVAEEPLQPVYFVVTPAGIECHLLDDIRRLVRRDVHVLQEISPAPGVDEIDDCAIDDAAASECASGSEGCGGRAGTTIADGFSSDTPREMPGKTSPTARICHWRR